MSNSERAYIEIRRRIIENEMPAGAIALEQDLANRLKMSRTPVREAMIRLANEGLIAIQPRHGFRVLPVSVKDMVDVYEILTALEASAVEKLAHEGISELLLGKLESAVSSMELALSEDNLEEWALADERFHKLLVSLTGNQRLQSTVSMFWDQTHRVRMFTLRLRPKPTRSNNDHKAVVEAIRCRDPAAAKALHTNHRKASSSMLVELLQRHKLREI